MPAEDEAESTTKATVSEGEIEIRDKENQKQDIAGLNRDTQNALNKLGEIFDKDSIEERQELAGLFGELAYNQIHFMEGTDEQKAAYHALVGGIMAELTNGDFLAGASAATVNKMVSDKFIEAANGDPAMAQWLSAAVGAVVSEALNVNEYLGSSITSSGIKNNDVLTGNTPINSVLLFSMLIAGKANVVYKNGEKIITDAKGTVIAICNEAGEWITDTGATISDTLSKGLDFINAKYDNYIFNESYPKSKKHEEVTDSKDFKPTGEPNSSKDKIDKDGNIVTRRWYDENGKAYKDVDYTNYGNAKNHPKVPHEHTWDWTSGKPVRK